MQAWHTAKDIRLSKSPDMFTGSFLLTLCLWRGGGCCCCQDSKTSCWTPGVWVCFSNFFILVVHCQLHWASDWRAPRSYITRNFRRLHPPLCHGCLKSVTQCDIDLKWPVVTATPMTRLDLSELPGWQLSFSQSRRTGHALFDDYGSICPPISHRNVKAQEHSESKAAQFWLSLSNFVSI